MSSSLSLPLSLPRRGKVVRLGQKTLMTILATCIESGLPCMIENIQIAVDAVLNPVIGRQTIKRGRNLVVKLGDKEIDYSAKFKLYLQVRVIRARLRSPHPSPSHVIVAVSSRRAAYSDTRSCSDPAPPPARRLSYRAVAPATDPPPLVRSLLARCTCRPSCRTRTTRPRFRPRRRSSTSW